MLLPAQGAGGIMAAATAHLSPPPAHHAHLPPTSTSAAEFDDLEQLLQAAVADNYGSDSLSGGAGGQHMHPAWGGGAPAGPHGGGGGGGGVSHHAQFVHGAHLLQGGGGLGMVAMAPGHPMRLSGTSRSGTSNSLGGVVADDLAAGECGPGWPMHAQSARSSHQRDRLAGLRVSVHDLPTARTAGAAAHRGGHGMMLPVASMPSTPMRRGPLRPFAATNALDSPMQQLHPHGVGAHTDGGGLPPAGPPSLRPRASRVPAARRGALPGKPSNGSMEALGPHSGGGKPDGADERSDHAAAFHNHHGSGGALRPQRGASGSSGSHRQPDCSPPITHLSANGHAALAHSSGVAADTGGAHPSTTFLGPSLVNAGARAQSLSCRDTLSGGCLVPVADGAGALMSPPARLAQPRGPSDGSTVGPHPPMPPPPALAGVVEGDDAVLLRRSGSNGGGGAGKKGAAGRSGGGAKAGRAAGRSASGPRNGASAGGAAMDGAGSGGGARGTDGGVAGRPPAGQGFKGSSPKRTRMAAAGDALGPGGGVGAGPGAMLSPHPSAQLLASQSLPAALPVMDSVKPSGAWREALSRPASARVCLHAGRPRSQPERDVWVCCVVLQARRATTSSRSRTRTTRLGSRRT